MPSSDNYGLPYPFGKSFPHEDDVPRFDRGSRNHSSLPPPPQIILPILHVHRLEMFKVTQALLASKHEDGKFVCAHILEMKLHTYRLGMLGVAFLRKLAIDLVLRSLPESVTSRVIWSIC